MEHLLSHTKLLVNQIYWFKQDFKIKPLKEHTGSAINWTDITIREHDFLNELVNTITAWVYDKQKVQQIVEERLLKTDGDLSNAASFLTSQAFSKFRPGLPQGQFGELILFNFIQHFFKAVPLLRKQRITTSVGHERFGADAVHYKKEGETNIIYLGESKCYESKYQFKTAFKISLESILNTVKTFNKELDLYVFDDFIEYDVEDIAKKYKSNELENVHFEMICLIAYNETNKITGANEKEIKESIKSIIEERCNSIEESLFDTIDNKILDRVNYIIFPIWELDKLLDIFQTKVGA